MTLTITRAAVRARLRAVLTNVDAIGARLGEPALPAAVAAWLGRLQLLYGVPYSYLVPDETMLPPESIRFFEIDHNWLEALVDGAFSIGRNLSSNEPTHSMALDAAIIQTSEAQALTSASAVRAAALGLPARTAAKVVGGFLLRSSVVKSCPGIGVNAYGGPSGDQARDLLRLEALGAGSDVLIALVGGDLTRVDIHQPPEHLHFGIDAYADNGAIKASKNIHPFIRGNPVKIDPSSKPIDFSGLFRPQSRRTLRVAATAKAVGAQNSAEMGFVMTEGVGQVSFIMDTQS